MTKHFKVLTLFPEFFDSPLRTSVLGRAVKRGDIAVTFSQIRDFTKDKHRRVDDSPYGGGCGLVMQVEPVVSAIREARSDAARRGTVCKVVFLSPAGRTFTQALAHEYARYEGELILLCGHYEGIDEREREDIDELLSMGDYILTGGEAAALCFIDAVSRLEDGVLGNAESYAEESYEMPLIEYAQYTRPEIFEGKKVPDVLLSGHHGEIEKWRFENAVKRTLETRVDLLYKGLPHAGADMRAKLNALSPGLSAAFERYAEAVLEAQAILDREIRAYSEEKA